MFALEASSWVKPASLRSLVPTAAGEHDAANPEAPDVLIEVGEPGVLSWIPRDAVQDADFMRLGRISQELQRRSLHVVVRWTDSVSPGSVVFQRCQPTGSQVLYVADHIREFYADGSGVHYDLALKALVTGVPIQTRHFTDES